MSSRREQTLETLHTAATAIQACVTIDGACERTVDAASDILEFEMCSIMLHKDGWLEPIALSEGAPRDGARRMADDQGLVGKTFQTGEPYLVEDVSSDTESDPAKPSYRSGISVPVGDVGVFQAVSAEPAGFDQSDIELAELLVAHTARTIDRLHYQRELQASQAALQRQNERLEEFASVVSHDLRNPLNVASGRLELARSECDSEHLQHIERAHDRMDTLIDDLLSFAQKGGEVDSLEPVALEELLQGCWSTMKTPDATYVLDSPPVVLADPGQLSQLFENLLRNSIDHGGRDVTITIGECGDGDGFYIADDGPGIPENECEVVFRRGFTTRPSGTGFGLAIVQNIADAHGWEIEVMESETGGARFELTGVELVSEPTESHPN